jgi:hypothetical protein
VFIPDGIAAADAADTTPGDGRRYGVGRRAPLLRRGPGGNARKSSVPADLGYPPTTVHEFNSGLYLQQRVLQSMGKNYCTYCSCKKLFLTEHPAVEALNCNIQFLWVLMNNKHFKVAMCLDCGCNVVRNSEVQE